MGVFPTVFSSVPVFLDCFSIENHEASKLCEIAGDVNQYGAMELLSENPAKAVRRRSRICEGTVNYLL